MEPKVQPTVDPFIVRYYVRAIGAPFGAPLSFPVRKSWLKHCSTRDDAASFFAECIEQDFNCRLHVNKKYTNKENFLDWAEGVLRERREDEEKEKARLREMEMKDNPVPSPCGYCGHGETVEPLYSISLIWRSPYERVFILQCNHCGAVSVPVIAPGRGNPERLPRLFLTAWNAYQDRLKSSPEPQEPPVSPVDGCPLG